ncbi:MAG: chromophore lyase CpcT/CpeT, partial [Cyanobacteria bacterium J06636_16]
RRFSVILLLSLGTFTPALAQTVDVPVDVTTPSSEPVEAVVNHLVGVMDTSAQAAVEPDRVSVQMTTCRIELVEDSSDAAGVYLYQEQALTERLDSPYRQRFLHIVADKEDERVESRTFKPIETEAWVGLCDRPLAERVIPTTAFSPEVVCTIELQPADSGYVGSTPPEGCPVNLRGAVRLTNTIVLHAAGMDTWDRGFDAAGNQVWGAEDTAYEFRWRDRPKSSTILFTCLPHCLLSLQV